MPEQFLHGIEIVEIDDGIRSIRTVKSSVIGVVGTAPDAEVAATASLDTGDPADDNAIRWTAKQPGRSGNSLAVVLKRPAASTPLSVSGAYGLVVVTCATDALGAIESTAAQVIAAVNASPTASLLVTAANAPDSDGSGVIGVQAKTYLAGGLDDAFPYHTPVLVAGSRRDAARLDTTGAQAGTLPRVMDDIFDQCNPIMVVIRVPEDADDQQTITNLIGGVNSQDGSYEGVHALEAARDRLGVIPRILIAPGFTHVEAVAQELIPIAERLKAMVIADGPNTTDEAAVQYRDRFGSPRLVLCDPWVKVRAGDGDEVRPLSGRAAGAWADSDENRGFWWSPSNIEIQGIVGMARPVSWALNDPNTRANYLNENEIVTVVAHEGYRLWGNRSCSTDPRWAFISTRRIADMLNESLVVNHLWAVDRNITRTYLGDVTEGVNSYIRSLVAQGALLGGSCSPNGDLNTPANIADGKVFFDFDFTPPYPAEHITFRSHLVQDYLEELVV